MNDAVDNLLADWRGERPELNYEALGIVVRVQQLGKLLRQDAEVALKPLQLRLWEYDVLSALRRQGQPHRMSASTLAKASMLTTGAMTTRIDGLEARGWVRREPDPDDRRGIQVSMTPAGQAIIDRAIGARLEAANQQLEQLTPRERASMTSGLRKLLNTQLQD